MIKPAFELETEAFSRADELFREWKKEQDEKLMRHITIRLLHAMMKEVSADPDKVTLWEAECVYSMKYGNGQPRLEDIRTQPWQSQAPAPNTITPNTITPNTLRDC